MKNSMTKPSEESMMSRPSEVYVRSLSPQEATSCINTPAICFQRVVAEQW